MPAGDSPRLLEAARQLAIDAATVRAIDGLAGADIETVLLRGPSIGLRLYDDPLERSYSDIDLLVRWADFTRAENRLVELGYREAELEAAFPGERPQHAHTWIGSDGIAVDLHRSLVGIPPDQGDVWMWFRTGAELVTVADAAVLVSGTPALAVTTALHAAHHGSRAEQPLRDLGRALDRLDQVTWDRAAELAAGLGATAGFASGLQLLARGEEERRRLGLDHRPVPDRRLAGARSFHVAQGISWLAAAPPRTRLAFLRERLVPSPRTMRQHSALARRGPLGLVAAHVVRWLDALRHLPRALRELRRAR